jgi:hypothetical protein
MRMLTLVLPALVLVPFLGACAVAATILASAVVSP